ncbi:FecR family protein [Chitinophaga sp. XS-30]|uniref:FecR family protein n=1 Tax=Chitinophaga sp. XS-30 TaxID=2604421 RepID=UPI0011DE0088|nr:FecR family protein [Chitinophaga sp. XS-30]QEH41912.1 FecR family protein [Chitinophaga sp. XS-30]
MDASRSRLEHLFERWFNNEATPAESEELQQLIEQPETDRQLPPLLKKAWEEMQSAAVYTAAEKDALASRILRKAAPRHTTRQRYYWAAAAVACLIAGGAIWASLQRSAAPGPATAAVIDTTMDVSPGKQGALLTLAGGQTIVLDSLGNGLIANQGGTQVVLNNGQLLYDADAAESVSYNTIRTPRGRKFMLVLPDETKVWLNAASSIRYPTAFTGNERSVQITGEAYFEVAKNKARPFSVNVNDQVRIVVLGTHFNIKAYDNEASANTTLLEGAVMIASGGKEQRIKPGQQARVSNGAIHVMNDVDMQQVTAWKDGYFNFNGASLQDVMRQLERWYDIDVHYQGNIPHLTFDGELPVTLQLSQVLKILHKVEVKYRIEEGKRLIILP